MIDFYPDITLRRYHIILASGSPRRKELLQQSGLSFNTIVRPVEEHVPDGLTPVEVVEYLCCEKATMFEQELAEPDVIVITADTIVVCDSIILNKPASEEEAFSMLKLLSGRWHEVHTGVCIRNKKTTRVFHETTMVHFRRLSDAEIRHYIKHFKPYDKAGGYGIQEWIGLTGIDGIQGSYQNVVGLPVHRVYEELKKLLIPE